MVNRSGIIKERLHQHKNKYLLDDLLWLVAKQFKVDLIAMKSKLKTRELSDARTVFMAVAVKLGYTYTETGTFVNRDHSTVCAAVKRIDDVREVKEMYNFILNKIINN